MLHCAFKLQQYLPFNFGTGCFLFISGCTNLQCNLFTAKTTLTQFKSWETEAADSCQKTWTTILNILFTKPFYFMHPVLHGRVIRRKLREYSINSTWKDCLSLVTIRVISFHHLVLGSFPRFNCLDYAIIFRHVQQQLVEDSCGYDACSLKMKNWMVKMTHKFKLI